MQRGRCGEKKKPSERLRRRWPDSFRRLAKSYSTLARQQTEMKYRPKLKRTQDVTERNT
jgi:hypothetical protein